LGITEKDVLTIGGTCFSEEMVNLNPTPPRFRSQIQFSVFPPAVLNILIGGYQNASQMIRFGRTIFHAIFRVIFGRTIFSHDFLNHPWRHNSISRIRTEPLNSGSI
jgi:hypothetical protein